VAALALAAIVAVSVAVVVSRSGGLGAGPLVSGIDGKEGLGWPLPIGRPGSIFAGVVRSGSDRQLVLDRVEGVGAQGGGPDIIGAYVGTPLPMAGRVYGYRVPADAQSLPGAVLGPNAELELVIGVKPTAPGRRTFQALAVLYHAGADSYRMVLPLGLAICGYTSTIPRCLDPLELSAGGSRKRYSADSQMRR
jgi:hypothetical protein